MTIKEQIIQKNYTKCNKRDIKYIVIHNTDNDTADGQQHWKYWNTNDKANSSAHYVVDDKEVIKLVNHNDIAWHCGKKYGVSTHPDCTNNNSIGIEICNHKTCDFDKAMENAIEVVKILMKELSITEDKVITHKMACGKSCPSTILKLNKWEWFKEQLIEVKPEVFYRVVCGSYSNRENADKMMEELKSKGYKPFIDIYRK